MCFVSALLLSSRLLSLQLKHHGTMKLFDLFSLFLIFPLCANTSPSPGYAKRSFSLPRATSPLQDIVTWDNSSILVNGERIFFLSGEFHPWRLPSPGLWLDVFQKIKALGFSGVSFYLMWGLLEGEPGVFRAEGVFAVEQFFEAAKQAGIYLLARPGPYINSETSGGGFPGWLQRIKAPLKSTSPEYEHPAAFYITHVAKLVAKAQITNGGPIILLQPDNEYTICSAALSGILTGGFDSLNDCLDPNYMAFVENAYRNAGIVVPFINNDAFPLGDWAPGTGVGAVDIYGYDWYPLTWGGAPCLCSTSYARRCHR